MKKDWDKNRPVIPVIPVVNPSLPPKICAVWKYSKAPKEKRLTVERAAEDATQLSAFAASLRLILYVAESSESP